MTTVSDEKVNEILQLPYSRVLIPDESGGYTAELLELRGCFSEGDTPEETYANLEEAAFNWVKAALKQGLKIPPPVTREGYSGRIALRLPKSLHRQAMKMAQRDGVSLNQFIITSIAARVGSYNFFERLEQRMNERLTALSNFQVFHQWRLASKDFASTWSTGRKFTWAIAKGEANVETLDLTEAVGEEAAFAEMFLRASTLLGGSRDA